MTNAVVLCPTNREPLSRRLCGGYAQSLWVLLLAGTFLLSACGGGGASSDPQPSTTLSGNWQFTVNGNDGFTNTPDLSSSSGLQGGFLLQSNGSAAGAFVYSNTLAGSAQGPCNSGSAPVTQTSSQPATFTVAAGGQTYTLTVQTVNSDGSSMSGSYTATPGPTVMVNGTPVVCGEGTTASGGPLPWTAKLVPPLTGSITGGFHSASGSNSGLANQDFPLTGTLTQGENIGASNATVTGTLSFIDPTTLLNDYPCISSGTVFVNGQISGNTVVLQLIGTDGSNDGQIGIPASQANSQTPPVTFDSTTNGYVLHSAGTGYQVNTKACAAPSHNDGGYICLGVNSTTACQQPITLSPALLSFPPQLLGSTNPSTQTITLTNTQPSGSASLTGLTLAWTSISGVSDTGPTDFTGVPNFTEADTCVPGEVLKTSGGGTTLTGSPFDLLPGQSCTVTVFVAPQASCTWLPNNGGTAPAQCPLTLGATLTVNNVPSVDSDGQFLVPITGSGLSFVQPSVPELDFGAEAFGEAGLPQLLNLTNYGATPVQILPKGTCVTAFGQTPTLPHPLMENSPVAGLQVVSNAIADPSQSTIQYSCDSDPSTLLPNFQISSDTCSGTLLLPQAACSLAIGYVPQSAHTALFGLDYFLELNTVQCPDPVNDPPSQSNPCELDGGRFPVELKANLGSPLRMFPAAGLSFGNVSSGKSSVPQTITLLNDPVPNAPTVNFVGKFVVTGSFTETDDCPSSLAPGGSCTLTVTFKPKAVGNNSGTISIYYTPGGTTSPQPVYLRGTGQ
jgi:hypothetical protein